MYGLVCLLLPSWALFFVVARWFRFLRFPYLGSGFFYASVLEVSFPFSVTRFWLALFGAFSNYGEC